MLIYCGLLAFSLILKPLLEDKRKYFIVMFGLFGVVAGVHAESVGADTLSYHQLFEFYSNRSVTDILFNYNYEDDVNIELGTRILIVMTSVISDSPQIFIFFSSVVSYALYGYFIYHNTNEKNYWIATSLILSMGFYFYSMSILRQLLATAIAIQGVLFLQNQCYVKAIFIVFVASMFHFTALVFLPIYLWIILLRNIIHKYRLMYTFGGTLIGWLLVLSVVGLFIVNNIEFIAPRIARYFLLSNIHSVGAENGLYYSSMIALYVSAIVLSTWMADKEINSNIKLMVFISSICVSADCICFILKEHMRIILRLAYHFEPFAWLLLSYAITGISSAYIRLYVIVIFVIVSFITLQVLGGLPSNWGAVPYEIFL